MSLREPGLFLIYLGITGIDKHKIITMMNLTGCHRALFFIQQFYFLIAI